MFKNIKIISFLSFFFCFIIFSSISQTNEDIPFDNIAIHEKPRLVSPIIFEDFQGNEVFLKNYKGNLLVLNFWATWCKPCKEEMPSLDKLSQDNNFNNIKVLTINMEPPNKERTKKFFTDLNIKNLSIFFDKNLNFVKEFKLRGIPTTILINKKGQEFSRIIGSIDFEDKNFLKWLSLYD